MGAVVGVFVGVGRLGGGGGGCCGCVRRCRTSCGVGVGAVVGVFVGDSSPHPHPQDVLHLRTHPRTS